MGIFGEKAPDNNLFKATRLIEEYFRTEDYEVEVDRKGSTSSVDICCEGISAPLQAYHFVSTDDDNDVRILGLGVARCPEGREAAILRAVNRCNAEYRFVRFYIHEGCVNMECDIPIKTADEDLGRVAEDLFLHMVSVYDDVYPILMKACWAN